MTHNTSQGAIRVYTTRALRSYLVNCSALANVRVVDINCKICNEELGVPPVRDRRVFASLSPNYALMLSRTAQRSYEVLDASSVDIDDTLVRMAWHGAGAHSGVTSPPLRRIITLSSGIKLRQHFPSQVCHLTPPPLETAALLPGVLPAHIWSSSDSSYGYFHIRIGHFSQ